jgi:hypothetical protein
VTLVDFIRTVEGFRSRGPTDQIRLFSWHLHTHGGRDRIQREDIGKSFDAAHIARPANLGQLVTQLVGRDLLKDTTGLRLSGELRDKYDAQYGDRDETVAVDKLLSDLPSKLSDPTQQDYLSEALICFRHKAFRAAIIMTWNVTYDHLTTTLARNHLASFNSRISTMFGGKKAAIAAKDDFQKLKESETLEVCKAAGLVSKEIGKVLTDKLDKRNSAAHPSGSTVDKLQAEAFISDLIRNAMVKIV